MSIEKQLTELTAAIKALTEATVANTAALAAVKADPHAEDDAYRRGMQAARAAQPNAPAAATAEVRGNGKLSTSPAQPAPAETKKPESDGRPTFPAPAEGEPLDYTKHVRPVMTHVISTKGSATVRTILEGLGVAKAPELKPDGLAKFYDALKAQL